MQLGMIGLGRMGANMVRRLMRGGHECVVFDVEPGQPSRRWPTRAPSASDSLEEFVAKLQPPRARLDDGARGRRRSDDRRARAARSSAATSSSTAATPTTSTTSAAPSELQAEGHPLRRRRHQRRRLGAGARLLPDDRRRDRRGQRISTRSSRRWLRRGDRAPRTPGREKASSTAEDGYLHCGPRRRALRQDGAQRHRVRPDGGVCGRDEHPASREHRQAEPRRWTPRRRRCATPSTISTISTSPEIAEVWRRGSVVASWLLDLTAAALLEQPELKKFSGRVSDSGEGRWTIMAAIERSAPAPVLSAALYQRFSVAGRSRLRRQAAVGHALPVRRPSRARGRRKIGPQGVLNDEGCRDTGSREVRRSVGARGAHERHPSVRGHP